MSLFRPKDRPDILPNQPKKEGIELGLTTIWRELFNLVKLNLIFIIPCIPVLVTVIILSPSSALVKIVCSLIPAIPIPAGITAMSRITCTMVRDENFYVWRDFWKAYKRDFVKSLIAGALIGFLLLAFGVAAYFWYQVSLENKIALLMTALSAAVFIIVYLGSLYFFPMLAYVDLPLKRLLINSLIMVMACWKRTLLALLGAAFGIIVGIGLLPDSTLFDLLITFSLTSLFCSFAVYPAIEERVFKKDASLLKKIEEKPSNAGDLKWEDEDPEPVSATIGEDAWKDDPDEKMSINDRKDLIS